MKTNDGSISLTTVLDYSIDYQPNILSEEPNNCNFHKQLGIWLGLVPDCMADHISGGNLYKKKLPSDYD